MTKGVEETSFLKKLFLFKKKLFFVFLLCWIFVAARAFSTCGKPGLLSVVCGLLIAVTSLVVEHGLYGMQTSVVAAPGFRRCSSWALELRLSSCSAWVQLLCSMWNLP